jgi:hypothetical protein
MDAVLLGSHLCLNDYPIMDFITPLAQQISISLFGVNVWV